MESNTNVDRKPFARGAKSFEADIGTLITIREYIGDWDGKNWAAVYALMRHLGVSPKELRGMSEFDIRMRVATYHSPTCLLQNAIAVCVHAIGWRFLKGCKTRDEFDSRRIELIKNRKRLASEVVGNLRIDRNDVLKQIDVFIYAMRKEGR